MPLTFTTVSNSTAQGTACSATTATGSTGDLIVAVMGQGSTSGIIPAAPSGTIAAGSWTAAAAGAISGGSGVSTRTFYASAPSASAVTVTMANSAGTTLGRNMLYVFRIAGAAFDAAPAATTGPDSSATYTPPNGTGTNGGLALVAAFQYTNGTAATYTVAAGWTAQPQLSGASSQYGGGKAANQDLTATGAVTAPQFGGGVNGTNSFWAGQMLTVKPVSGPASQTVSPTAAPTAEAHGTTTVNRGPVTLTPPAVASGEAHGATAVSTGAVTLTPAALASGEAHGATVVTPQSVIAPAGVPSGESVGSPSVVVQGVVPASIGSGEAFGTPGVSLRTLGVTSIPSGEASGAPTVTPGTVTVSPAAVPSGELFGTARLNLTVAPAATGTGEQHGTATLLPGPVTITPAAVPSGEVFGTAVVVLALLPPGIPAAQAVGAPRVNLTVHAAAVPSGEVFGTARLNMRIVVPAIGPGELFGTPTITTTIDVTVRRGRPRIRTTATYEMVAVARVPQTSGPPVLLEVDPILWSGLSYIDELSRPQRLDASCPISTLTDPVVQRLEKLADLATELWLYRDGRLVFAGPWLGWSVQGETLTMQAAGLLSYTRYMVVTEDLVFNGVDQFTIVRGLIDHWQGQEFGHFGIDTDGSDLSGQLRDATYLKKELHPIGQRIDELGRRQGGFDVEVDPASRRLRLWSPQQGVDRSAGEDAIVFDARNVTSTNVSCSVAPGDVASEAFGTGTGGDTVYTVRSNLDLRAKFGRTAVTGSFDGVSEQATLDAHAQGLLDARGEALLIPGPDVRTTPDADLSAYSVGDTVSYQLHERLGVRGAFRLRKRQVSVSNTGVESASFEFV